MKYKQKDIIPEVFSKNYQSCEEQMRKVDILEHTDPSKLN